MLARLGSTVNREPNNGRGPVDYKINAGAHDKSLIEFKLAKSSSLKRNLQWQVEVYEAANKTKQSMKVISSIDMATHQVPGIEELRSDDRTSCHRRPNEALGIKAVALPAILE